MKTIQNHLFDLILARDAKWPLVAENGQKAVVVKWDSWHPDGNFPLCGLIYIAGSSHRACHWNADGRFDPNISGSFDIFLSADYGDPEVRAAVQRAHVLGKQVVQSCPGGWVQCDEPYWNWDHHGNGYMLAHHVPAPVDPIAPGHNSHQLTMSQVGEGRRLVDASEGFGANHEGDWYKATEIWASGNKWMDTNQHRGERERWSSGTLRTRLSREALAALDAPPKKQKPVTCVYCGSRFGAHRASDAACPANNLTWANTKFTSPRPAWTMPIAPAGQQWHREDFSEADLPPVTDGGLPWRPFLSGENGTGQLLNRGEWIELEGASRVVKAKDWQDKQRTRRPLPSAPKLRAWNKQDDVPGPVCWIRRKSDRHNCVAMVVFMDDGGIHAGNESSICYINITWHEVSACEYSTDRKTWHPCEVTE